MRSPFFSTLLLFFALAAIAQGQSIEQYQGFYRMGNWSGWAQFDYLAEGEKRRKQGAFEMHSQLELSQWAEELTVGSARGQYDEDQAQGSWYWKQARVALENQGRLSDGYYQVPLSGNELQLQGALDQAKAVQTWQMLRVVYKEGQLADSLAKHRLQFSEQGNLQSFSSYKDRCSLQGNFDVKQRLQGNWELHLASDSLLQMHFEEGLLRFCTWSKTGDSLFLWGKGEKLKLVDFDSDYLRILHLQAVMNHAAPHYLNALRQWEQIWETFASDWQQARAITADFLASKKTWPASWQGALPLFALSEEEKKALRAIERQLHESDSLYEQYAQNPELHELQKTSETLSAQWQKVEQWRKREWRALDSLYSFQRRELLKHLDRELLSSGFFKNQLWGELTEEPGLDSGALGGLEKIAAWSQAQGRSLRQSLSELQVSLDKAAKQQKLSDAEIVLKRRYKLWQSKLDSCQKISEDSPLIMEYHWQQLRSQSKNWYRDFENSADPAERLQKATALQECYPRMIELAEALAQVPEQFAGVKRAYTQEVWNPYTYTTMEEIVKERLFKSYQNLILPGLIQALSEKPQCAMAQKQAQSLTQLRDRMLELRDEDSDDLERLLRRSPELKDILPAMGLEWDWL